MGIGRTYQWLLWSVALLLSTSSFGQKVIGFGEPQKLPASINSDAEESTPFLSSDGSTLYFVRTFHDDNTGGEGSGQDIWYSTKLGADWSEPQNDLSPINNEENNVVAGFTGNDSTMFVNYSYGTNRRLNRGLSVSELGRRGWSEPRKIRIPKLPNNDGHYGYFVDRSGKVMLLSLLDKDSYGEEDLYISFANDKGDWSEPVNLGQPINTTGYEMSPYLSADGQTLYFASNGHGGLGDADIFRCQRLDSSWTNWSAPENLGAPYNSPQFDAYFMIGQEEAFFASNRNTELGDLYRLTVEREEPEPEPEPEPDPEPVTEGITAMSGVLEDAAQPAANVKLKLLDENGKVVGFTTTDKQGQFRFSKLDPESVYQVKIDESDVAISESATLKFMDREGDVMMAAEREDSTTFSFRPLEENAPPVLDMAQEEAIQGVLETEERPVAGIRLKLVDKNGLIVGSTTTDASGQFSFSKLDADANYLVLIDEDDAEIPDDAKLFFTDDGGDKVAKAGKENEATFSFTTLGAMATSADALALSREEDVSGILETANEPVAGIRLKLVDKDGKVVGTTTTNAAGKFSFTKLDADANYMVLIDEEDAGIPDDAKLFFTDDAGEKVATASKEDASTFAFNTLPRQSPDALSLLNEEEVKGVFKVAEVPTAGVRLKLVDNSGEVVGYAVTNRTGQFTFTKLNPDASYMVQVDEEDGELPDDAQLVFIDQQGDELLEADHQGGTNFAFRTTSEERVVEKPEEEAPEQVEEIRGRVEIEDATGSGVRVKLLDESGNLVGYTFTDAEGSFKFSKLDPEANYLVQIAESDGDIPDNVSLYLADNEGETKVEKPTDASSAFAVKPGTGQSARVRNTNRPQVPDDEAVMGRVLIREGTFSGIRVQLKDASGKVIGYDTTDNVGEFHFTGLDPKNGYAIAMPRQRGFIPKKIDFAFINSDGEVIMRPTKGSDGTYNARPNFQRGSLAAGSTSGTSERTATRMPTNLSSTSGGVRTSASSRNTPDNRPEKPPWFKPTPRKVPSRVVLDEPAATVFFAFNSIYVGNADERNLNKVARSLRSDPNANAFIYSYTDNVGTEEENQQVAYLRASAVKRYLVGMGIAEDRLHIQDFITGANANDTSSEARAAQRRVDVLLE